MARYKITVDYIGSGYCGWQVQPEKVTVQGELQRAITDLTGETAAVIGSGRTDSGVHAVCQTAHFDLQREWEARRIAGGLNHYLPSDIRVLSAEIAPNDFHARYDCKQKTYSYLIYNAPERAVLRDRAWAVEEKLDVSAMNEAAAKFVGTRDFASFMAAGSDVKNSVRTVTRATVEERDGFIVFTVSADGFLYNMVRIMTALLADVGRGRLKVCDAEDILCKRDRTVVKGIAPACGLYLMSQEY